MKERQKQQVWSDAGVAALTLAYQFWPFTFEWFNLFVRIALLSLHGNNPLKKVERLHFYHPHKVKSCDLFPKL